MNDSNYCSQISQKTKSNNNRTHSIMYVFLPPGTHPGVSQVGASCLNKVSSWSLWYLKYTHRCHTAPQVSQMMSVARGNISERGQIV